MCDFLPYNPMQITNICCLNHDKKKSFKNLKSYMSVTWTAALWRRAFPLSQNEFHFEKMSAHCALINPPAYSTTLTEDLPNYLQTLLNKSHLWQWRKPSLTAHSIWKCDLKIKYYQISKINYMKEKYQADRWKGEVIKGSENLSNNCSMFQVITNYYFFVKKKKVVKIRKHTEQSVWKQFLIKINNTSE